MLSGEFVTVEFYAISIILSLVVGVIIGYSVGLDGKRVLDYEKQMDKEKGALK